jgi:hypothetical protein
MELHGPPRRVMTNHGIGANALGFIKYNGGLHVDTSLLSVVLHE